MAKKVPGKHQVTLQIPDEWFPPLVRVAKSKGLRPSPYITSILEAVIKEQRSKEKNLIIHRHSEIYD